MNWNTSGKFGKAIDVLCASLLLLSFTSVGRGAAQTTAVASIMAAMSLEQKVAQMFMVSFYGAPINEPARALLRDWQPGAVVLLPSNLGDPEHVTRLTNDIQTTLVESGGVPALIAIDQEGGVIARLRDGFTEWPVPMLLTATQDEALAFQFGQALGDELRAVGINMNLAPVADLNTNPDNPIIGRRSFGSDPQLVAPIVAQVAQGMQAAGVLATAKHFPGHGDTATDSHLTLPIISHSQSLLSSRELQPFQATIDVNVAAIMTAHIVFPALEVDSAQPQPASLSSAIIQNLLRAELGYNGLVITDALDMDAIDVQRTPESAAIAAIQAGNDLILTGAHIGPDTHRRVLEATVNAVQTGIISEERVDQSVERILSAKFQYDLLDWQPLVPETATQRISITEHAQLIEQLFRKGITVVNDGEAIPLAADTLFIYPATQPSLWRACDGHGWRGLGVSATPTEQEIAWAMTAAQSAEHVAVITQDVVNNAAMQRLIAALPLDRTTVIALQSPYDVWALPQTAGYVVSYSPLPAGYKALCTILRGEQAALGTLSITLTR